jgi:prepilin-type processing-associated H-X9-DG protein
MFDPCSPQGQNNMPPIAPSDKPARADIPIPSNAIIARHHDFCNLTFADGHAKSVNLSNLNGLSTPHTANRPTKWRVYDCSSSR